MHHLTSQNWALSAGVFLPLVGVAVMFFIPAPTSSCTRSVALVTASATLGVGHSSPWSKFDYGRASSLQFYKNRRTCVRIPSVIHRPATSWVWTA